MKKRYLVLIVVGLGSSMFGLLKLFQHKLIPPTVEPHVLAAKTEQPYWFLLHRKSNREFLYQGVPGSIEHSQLVKKFTVKSGQPGERPTPLPQLLGRAYWIMTSKRETQNPESAPYFLTLNVPWSKRRPFGPEPYLECDGQQCDWGIPGEFGLHGINGDLEKLADSNLGSSGCIRHGDEDITLLYNLLEPSKMEIRYYIEDR